MSTPVEQHWPTSEEDKAWADRVVWRLAVHEAVPSEVADDVLAEARQACREAERPAAELFGDADGYAAAAARERVPAAERAAVDLDGSSPRDGWSAWLLTVGWGVTVLGVLLLVVDGWTVPVTGWGLAVLVAALGLGTGCLWGVLERQAGRVRRGWVCWSGGVAALAAALAIGSLVDDRPVLAVLPTPVLLLVGAVLTVVGFTRPAARRVLDEQPGDTTPQAWFDRLAGLLRGRYLLPRREVARHVAEARAHWLDSGAGHPRDEFGPAATHALQLMDGSPLPRAGRRRQTAWLYTVVSLFWCWMVLDAASTEGVGWGLAWRVAGLALFTTSAAHEWRQLHRGRLR